MYGEVVEREGYYSSLLDGIDILRREAERVQEVISRIHFQDWKFEFSHTGDKEHYVRLVLDAPDTTEERNGNPNPPVITISAACFIPRFASESEIVAAVWEWVQKAVLHETAEHFVFDGTYPFWPHKGV